MVPGPRRQDRLDPGRLRRPPVRANVQPLIPDRGTAHRGMSVMADRSGYFAPLGSRRGGLPLRGRTSRPAGPQENPRPNRRGAGLLEESPALEDRTQRGILQAPPARI